MMDKRLLKLVPGAMRHVAATVGWQWIGLLGNAAMVWTIALALSSLVCKHSIPPFLWPVLACGIAARTVSARFSARESFAASQDVKGTLRRLIYEKLLLLGPSYTEYVPTAEVVQLSVEGCEQLETYFGQYLPQLFYSVLAPLTLFIMVAPLCFPAAVVLLVCVPLIPVTIAAVQKVAKKILGNYWNQYAELGGAVAGMAVALGFAAAGSLDLFACLFIILISADFFLPMRQLGSYFHVAMNGIAASEKIFRLLEAPEPLARSLKIEQGSQFSLEHASFGYEKDRVVLDDICLQIPATGLTAIVGESGSGKSTIAALLSGRLDGYSGEVLLGKNQVREIDRKALSRHVTVVGLGAHLFAGTVADNLRMAKPNATDAELWRALELARLAEFLHQNDGLQTRLTENAANLSGGQRQRLALARAILHDSPVYIFDEATSNVDVESEEDIMRAVCELARTKAVVVISHRLANAVPAQKIYVLDHGAIAGAGTHDELLKTCETYSTLWSAQAALERLSAGTKEVAQDAE